MTPSGRTGCNNSRKRGEPLDGLGRRPYSPLHGVEHQPQTAPNRRSGAKVRLTPRPCVITFEAWSLAVAGDPAVLVTPINTATNTAGNPITVAQPTQIGIGPDAIAITSNGKSAYVASFSGAAVIPIRTATNTKLRTDQGRAHPPRSRSRHQHRAQRDQDREQPLCHRDHAVTSGESRGRAQRGPAAARSPGAWASCT